MCDLQRIGDALPEKLSQRLASYVAEHVAEQIRVRRAVDGLLAGIADHWHVQGVMIPVRIGSLALHYIFVARRSRVPIVAIVPGCHHE